MLMGDESSAGSAQTANGQVGGECITVFARVRPSKTPSAGLELRHRSLDLLVPRRGGGAPSGAAEVGTASIDRYSFAFSEVFGPGSSQQQVFESVARDLVLGALDGVNCTIFAYGQTGSGKTFTVCGGKENHARDRGLIPRTLGLIFDEIDRRDDGVHYAVSMSMIEVYKEIGYDLLVKDFRQQGPKRTPTVSVSIKGDHSVVHGAKRVALASEEDGVSQYFLGDVHRTVAATAHNLASSRSHCVCTLFLEASDPAAQVVRTSKVQLVDLAGSERLKPNERGSQEKKSLMKEAVAINLSLHYLSAVIGALNNRSKLVPYRNSFLTKLLKDALGGNAKAAMVMTVDPSDAALPETICSCRFAQNVANVQTNARINEERDPQLLIEELRRRNAELQAAAESAVGGVTGRKEPSVPEDEMRIRIHAFLEDETGGGDGGAGLKVGPMPHGAYAAFRIFRELFWQRLLEVGPKAMHKARGRPSAGASTTQPANAQQQAGDSLERESSWLTAAEEFVNQHDDSEQGRVGESDGQGAGQAQDWEARITEKETELQQLHAECRMLRAALASQPAPRPTGKGPKRVSREAKLQSDLYGSQAECRRLRKALATLSAAARPLARPRRRPKARQRRPASCGPPQTRESRDSQRWSQNSLGDSTTCSRDSLRATRQSGTRQDIVTQRTEWSAVTCAAPLPHSASAVVVSPAASASKATLQPGRPRSAVVIGNTSNSVASAVGSSTPSLPALLPVAAVDDESIAASIPVVRTDPRVVATMSVAATTLADQSHVEQQPSVRGGCLAVSSGWLSATTALTTEELERCGSTGASYQLFLQRDPRAGDVWPAELQKLRARRRACMEEARTLGECLLQTKDAMRNVQAALESLKARLREAEDAASVDASAQHRAQTLRTLIAAEEPRQAQLLEEKRQQYQLDTARLRELKQECSHTEHRERVLEATIQEEFRSWQRAVEQRYPLEVATAVAAEVAAAEDDAAEKDEEGEDGQP